MKAVPPQSGPEQPLSEHLPTCRLATGVRPCVAGRKCAGRRSRHLGGDERISTPRGDGKARRRLPLDEIKRRFPHEFILVVRYGDHQPSATRDLINGKWGDDSPEFRDGMAPSPYITFYAIAGQN